MRELLRDYFDGGVSRRGFFRHLVAAGFTASAARSVLEAAESGGLEGAQPASSGAYRQSGTGGDLLLEQIKAAGT